MAQQYGSTPMQLIGALPVCKSLELSIPSQDLISNISSLAGLGGSLERLSVWGKDTRVEGLSALTSLSCLSKLEIWNLCWGDTECPWRTLASLVSLQKLTLGNFVAFGDPSALSALTGLISLEVSRDPGRDVGYAFSTLQPLRTLQALEDLDVQLCTAISL
jgi:hypothetical protein